MARLKFKGRDADVAEAVELFHREEGVSNLLCHFGAGTLAGMGDGPLPRGLRPRAATTGWAANCSATWHGGHARGHHNTVTLYPDSTPTSSRTGSSPSLTSSPEEV